MAKILYYDIEIAKAVFEIKAYDRKLYTKYLPSDAIKHPKWLICAAWKWLDENHVSGVSVLNDPERFKNDFRDDYFVVKTLRDVIDQADIVVGHNANNFDWKELKAKIVYHNLPPLPHPQMIDTLKFARSECRFMANDMKYLCKQLECSEQKGSSADRDKIDDGCPDAIKKELKYCMQDIRAGVKLYERVKPYMSNHPNLGLYEVGVHHHQCPRCLSHDVIKRGFRYTKAGKYQQFKCKACGSWSQSGKSLKKIDLR